ncbi:aminoacyl-tRNA hydrolase [Thiospirillum jenense]|uniref:aminoacyl-tRNA hydrolase n=1 Tax=Thiospirillum jenense TaxID=1653858 RepID=UPI0030B832E7
MNTAIQLCVGLGNPGAEYAMTRHNAGFWLIDRIAAVYGEQFRTEARFHGQVCRIHCHGQEVRLLKPMTFVNQSGRAVAAIARYFNIPSEQILLAYDELDLPPGQVRLKQGGGHAGHNGVRNTLALLDDGNFWRLRIGIGHPGTKQQVVNYVLNAPSKTDTDCIDTALTLVVQQCPELFAGQFQRVMNRLHVKPASE